MKTGIKILLLSTLFISSLLTRIDAKDISLDLDRIPFSIRGSYFAISTLKNRIPQDTLYINHFIGLDTRQVFKIFPSTKGGTISDYNLKASPWMLSMQTKNSKLEICYESPKIIRIKNIGNGIKLFSNEIKYPIPMPGKKQFRILGKNRYDRFIITCISGNINFTKSGDEYIIDITPEENECEIAIEEYVSEWIPREYTLSFDECIKIQKSEFENFISEFPVSNTEYEEAINLALYINWSSIVYPRGLMKRPGMLMSKNWMNYIWSWDNCFNAIGMANIYPNIAWDQIMVVLENQDQMGILPDRFRDVFIHYGFTKPPVYGFTIDQLEKVPGLMNKDRYSEVYPYLKKLTDFWLNYRDDNNNMLPEYHHGNDSGWDNATVFDIGFPVEGPDLSSFLIIQMDKLSEIAQKLGLETESADWKIRADNLFKKLMSEFWVNGRFVYKNSITNEYEKDSKSLLPFIPIVLGKRLPFEVQNKLVNDLKGSGIITEYGLATENPASSKYGYDSYWRGPIWAPSTYIIVEGLNQCGEKELAKDIAKRFCDLCKKNGFAENFDAVTGKAFRDQAYTWTASVFLAFIFKYQIGIEK